MVITSMTWAQVSPPKQPAFIANAPPSVPGIPQRIRPGPTPFHALLAIRARQRPPRNTQSLIEAIERSSVPTVLMITFDPTVTHNQVAGRPTH